MSIAKFAIISKNNKTEGKKVTLKKKLYFFHYTAIKTKVFVIYFGSSFLETNK